MALLLSADFGRLWGAQAVTQLAARGSTLMFPLVAVIAFDATPGEVGLVNATQFAPVFVVTLFAGAWLDDRRRRPAIVAAHLGRAALLALPLVSLWWHGIWPLVAFSVLVGGLTALADVACHAYVPGLVPREDLLAANSRLELTNSLAQVAAPGLGGVLIGVAGASWSMVAVGACFLVGASAVSRIRHREPLPPAAVRGPGLFRRIADGWRFVAASPVLRSLVVQAGWFNLCEQAVMTVYLLYAVRVLGFGPAEVGMTIALGAAGAVIGSLVARRFEQRAGVGHVLLGAMAVASVAPVPLLVRVSDRGVSLVLCTATFFLFALGLTVFNVFSVSARQRISPPRLIGRVTATFRFIAFGTIWVGAMAGGFGAEALGLEPMLLACAAGLGVGWVVFLFSVVRNGFARARLVGLGEPVGSVRT